MNKNENMNFSRTFVRFLASRFISACFLFLLSACPLAGAVEDSDQSVEMLMIQGRAALEDEFYDMAGKIFETLLKQAEDPREKAEYALMLSAALHGLQKYENMLNLLLEYREHAISASWADVYEARIAKAYFALDRWQEVIAEANRVEREYPESPLIADMIRLKALSFKKQGDIEKALAWFELAVSEYQDSPDYHINLLDWGLTLSAAGNDAEAEKALKRLTDLKPEGRIAHECGIELGATLARQGQNEEALMILKPLLTDERMLDESRVKVIRKLVDLAESEKDLAKAVSFVDSGLSFLKDPVVQGDVYLLKGRILVEMNNAANGVALVRNFVSSQSSTDLARDVHLKFAQILLDSGSVSNALVEYQNYLDTFSDSSGIVRANEGRGWALFKLGRYDEAASAFEAAIEQTNDEAVKAENLFKMGDSHFAAGRFNIALKIYETIIKEYPETPIADRALFQAAETRLRLGEHSEGELLLWELVDKDAQGPLAGTALLRVARLRDAIGKTQEALSVYSLVFNEIKDEGARAKSLHGIGDVYYRVGNFKEALSFFETVISLYPKSEAAEMSGYMLGWTRYMLGNEDLSVVDFKEFIKNYPDSVWTPHAVFRLGEQAYNSGAYVEAEAGFNKFAVQYSSSRMADTALFWAGRAAMMQKEFRRANEYFARLIKDYPAGNKRAEARFYQGESLCEMGEFAGAILIFDEIIKMLPQSYLAKMAWFRKGDSQFTLGSEDPERYNEAIVSYRFVLNLAETSLESKWQAEYKIGRCLEKLGQNEEAFEYYIKVVYSYPGYWNGNPRSNVWFTRAAFNAAELMEREKQWSKAINVYQRVVDAGVPAGRDAQERINKIRSDNWRIFY